jgi:hypothetical protein
MYLTYALLRVQVAEGSAAESRRSVEDQTFSVAVEATFSKNGSHAFGLDGMKLFLGEMTIGERISNARKVYGEIIGPCLLSVEGAALHEDAGVVALG